MTQVERLAQELLDAIEWDTEGIDDGPTIRAFMAILERRERALSGRTLGYVEMNPERDELVDGTLHKSLHSFDVDWIAARVVAVPKRKKGGRK